MEVTDGSTLYLVDCPMYFHLEGVTQIRIVDQHCLISMKIYFCGSIRGGRQDADLYQQIITMLQNYGEVLTEHNFEEEHLRDFHISDGDIFVTDTTWLQESDVVVAEVTQPSLGVGVELGVAWKLNKKILCLFRPKSHYSLSAMVTGAQNGTTFKVINYETLDQIKNEFDIFLKISNDRC